MQRTTLLILLRQDSQMKLLSTYDKNQTQTIQIPMLCLEITSRTVCAHGPI